MKKTLLTFLAICGTFSIYSQDFTQANEPMIGETKSMFLCDSFATDYAGTIGSGVTWDYSTLTSYVGQTKSLMIEDATSTPFASDYPASTAATRIEDFTYTFINSTATNRSSDGYVLEDTDIGDVKAKFTSDAQLLMNYPSALGASVVDSFAGNLSFVYSQVPQNPACTGISYATYDGLGTFIQPDGTTLTGISRYHFADTLWTTIPVIGAAQIIRSQFEYYDLSAANHLPVFLHISAKLVSGFPTPLIDATVVLSEIAGPMTASLKENGNSPYLVYPNPATDKLTIQNLQSDSEVTLTDLSGRMVTLNPATLNTFSLEGIAKGTYLLNVNTQERTETQTIIIE